MGRKLDPCKRSKKRWLLTLMLPRVIANNQLLLEVDLEVDFWRSESASCYHQYSYFGTQARSDHASSLQLRPQFILNELIT